MLSSSEIESNLYVLAPWVGQLFITVLMQAAYFNLPPLENLCTEMGLLLRRRSSRSSCFQFFQSFVLHKPYEASHPLRSPFNSQTPCRDWITTSRITESDVRLGVRRNLVTERTIWGPDKWRGIRCVHTVLEEIKAPQEKKRSGIEQLTLYRAKWIRPIRLLVRLKLIQLGGVMALVIPLAEYSKQGSLSLGTTLAVGAVVGGAGAASTTLWYYSRRLIGEMALLLPDLRIMQISVLDFWGNREDLQYDIRDIVPPLKGMTKEELERASQQIVIPLDVIGDRQFFLSLRHGYLVHKDILFSVLNGSVEARDLRNMEFRV